MTLSIEVAKPYIAVPAWTGFSWTLTPPANAVGLVVAINDGTFSYLTYGGLSIGLTLDGHLINFWELLDLTGASGTVLAGETQYNLQQVAAAWLVDTGPVERVDVESGVYEHGPHVTTFTVTPDRAGCAALVVGSASSGGGVVATDIAPYTGQTQLTEGDFGGGIGSSAMNMSWRGGISTPTAVGMTDSSAGAGWNSGLVAALYAPTARTIMLGGLTEEADFTGLTIAPSGPAMVYLSRRPVERAGFRGLTIRASGPRNVALVGRHLGTSEMTDVPAVPGEGPDVPVLRYRRSALPAYEQLADLATEAGIGGSSLTVEQDGETPVTPVDHIVFDGATVTDDTGGQVTVTVVPGSSLTVEDESQDVQVASVDTIVFPDGTVTDLTGGAVGVREVPTGVIGCALYNSAVQSIPAAGANPTPLTLDTEEWDSDGFHSTSTNTSRVTIPVGLGGRYLIIGKTYAPFTAVNYKYIGVSLNGATTFLRRVGGPLAATGDTMDIVAVMTLAAGDFIELGFMHDNAGSQNVGHASARRVQTELSVYKLGSGNVSGLDTARARRTSGNLTLNSTTWVDVDTGMDLVVPAQAGDVLLVALGCQWANEAISPGLDAVTVVGGSPVNSISGAGASDYGVMGWGVTSSVYAQGGGGIQYVVQAADLSGGLVTLRLRYRGHATGNKTLFATANYPLHWSVVNLRGGAASRDIGYEFAYAERTTNLTISSTSEASPDNVVSAPAVILDGNTKVCVEVFCAETSGDTEGTIIVTSLWDGSTDLGRFSLETAQRATDWRLGPLLARRFLTPSAGSHTFHWKAFKGGVAGLAELSGFGAGGSGTRMPGYIRVTKA